MMRGVSEKYESKIFSSSGSWCRLPNTTKSHDRELVDELMELYETSVTKDLFRSVMIDEGGCTLYADPARLPRWVGLWRQRSEKTTLRSTRMTRFYTLAKQQRFNLYIPPSEEGDCASRIHAPASGAAEAEVGLWRGWKDALYGSRCHLPDAQKGILVGRGSWLAKFEAENQRKHCTP